MRVIFYDDILVSHCMIDAILVWDLCMVVLYEIVKYDDKLLQYCLCMIYCIWWYIDIVLHVFNIRKQWLTRLKKKWTANRQGGIVISARVCQDSCPGSIPFSGRIVSDQHGSGITQSHNMCTRRHLSIFGELSRKVRQCGREMISSYHYAMTLNILKPNTACPNVCTCPETIFILNMLLYPFPIMLGARQWMSGSAGFKSDSSGNNQWRHCEDQIWIYTSRLSKIAETAWSRKSELGIKCGSTVGGWGRGYEGTTSTCLQPAEIWNHQHPHLAAFAGGDGAATGLAGMP